MRRLLVPAAVVLMLLSGSAVAAAAEGPLAAAAAKTLRQGSEQVSLTATIDLGPTFGKADLKAAGPYDQGAKRGTLKGTLALAGSGKTPVTEVFDGATLYVDSPLFAALLPPGKTWLAINLQKPGTVAGFDLGSLAGQSPASVLAADRKSVV